MNTAPTPSSRADDREALAFVLMMHTTDTGGYCGNSPVGVYATREAAEAEKAGREADYQQVMAKRIAKKRSIGMTEDYEIVELPAAGFTRAADQGWVACAERMPPKDGPCLVFRPAYVAKDGSSYTYYRGIAYYYRADERPWWDREYHGEAPVTHWAPLLPPPPEKGVGG